MRLHGKRLGSLTVVGQTGELGLPDCMPVLCQLLGGFGGGLCGGICGIRHVDGSSEQGRCAAPL
jgi:hypothetical protein